MLRLMMATPVLSCLVLGSAASTYAQEAAPKTTNSVIREHMEVVGSDKQHVGVVDKYEGSDIKLTKNDPASGGQHHTVPSSWVGTINDNTVILSKTAAEAMAQWSSDN